MTDTNPILSPVWLLIVDACEQSVLHIAPRGRDHGLAFFANLTARSLLAADPPEAFGSRHFKTLARS